MDAAALAEQVGLPPAGQNGVGAGAAPPPRTFASLYASMPLLEDNDLTALYGLYNPTIAAPTPQQLYDNMVNAAASNDMPYVFAMVQGDVIVHLHLPRRFPTPLLNPPEWCNTVFGFQGDIDSNNNINYFVWPHQPFGRLQL